MSPRKQTNVIDWIKAWLNGVGVEMRAQTESTGFELVALEDRVLYSAVPLSVDMLEQPQVVYDADNYQESNVASFAEAMFSQMDSLESYLSEIANLDSAAASDAGLNLEIAPRELMFVDKSVENHEALVADILNQSTAAQPIKIFYLDSQADGVQQISDILTGLSDVQAIHLVTHGTSGQVAIGNTNLNSGNLNDYGQVLGQWKDHLSVGADLLIYGCDVAASDNGESFVTTLAAMTGIDVAASDDLTGHVTIGGDWDFEYQTGGIESTMLFSVDLQESWYSTLAATQTITVDSGDSIPEDTSGEGRGSQQAVAMDAQGNSVVVWSAQGPDGDGWGVFARRYDHTGTAVGNAVPVNDNVSGDQQWSSVAMDAAGNYVVTWTDADHNEVNLKRFAADGTELTGETRVNNPTLSGTASGSTIAMNDSGAFVITWVGEGLGVNREIYASLFDNSGTVLADSFLVNTTILGDQLSPGVSINNSGNFVITWHDGDGVYAQRYNANGSINGGEIDVASNSSSPFTVVNDFASVGLQNDNSFAVAYNNTVNGNDGPSVWRYDSSGSAVGFMDPNETSTNSQGDVSIQVGTDGTYLVVWEGYGNQTGEADTNGGVFGRLYSAGGSSLTGEFLINSHVPGSQNNVSAAIFDQNNYVFVYSGVSALDSQGVYFSQVGGLNQLPTGSDATINTVLGQLHTLSATDFGYSDADGDSFTQVEIQAVPSAGELYLNGSLVTAGQTVSVSDISSGLLKYLPAAAVTGTNIDQFSFFVNDGIGNSAATNDIFINTTLQPSFWFSTKTNESGGPSELPTWDSGEVIEFGGPNLELGSSTVADGFESFGELALRFSLQSAGLNVDALHFVSQDVTIAASSSSPFALQVGDLMFSIKENGKNFGGLTGVDSTDILVFRPTTGDYSTGTFSYLIDMSSPTLTDPDLPFSDTWSLSLIENDVLLGDTTLNAGELIYSKQGSSVDSNIYVMNVTETGENTTQATAWMLIDGAEVGIDEQIRGLDVTEAPTTIGGRNYGAGMLFVTLDKDDVVGTAENLVTEKGDVFALQMTTSSVFGAANAAAELVFDLSDTNPPVNNTGTGNVPDGNEFDAFTLVTQSVSSNRAPSVADQSFSIPENSADSTFIGQVVASDPDTGDTLTYSIVSGDPDGAFAIDGSGNITVADSQYFDHETYGAYSLTVRVTDSAGLNDTATIDVTVDDVNENPTDIAPNTVSVDEYTDTTGGFSLGSLTATDEDGGEIFSYAIVGGADAAFFSISGAGSDELILTDGILDFETKASYSVTVRVTDSGGLTYDETLTINVNDISIATLSLPDLVVATVDNPEAIQYLDLLQNDIDPDNTIAEMSIVIVGQPQNGVLIDVNGQLVYTPNPGFAGSDSFEYVVQAGGSQGNTAEVTIVVSGGTGSTPPVTEPDLEDEDSSDDPIDPSAGTGGQGNVTEPTNPVVGGGSDKSFSVPLADIVSNSGDASESDVIGVELKEDETDESYDYSENMRFAELAVGLANSRTADRTAHHSLFDNTLLAGMFWEDLDDAKREFLINHFQVGVPAIAASTASFLTVGYLAWIIRGGVLLTTFMSSLPAWKALDILPIIESSNLDDEDDESIEQMVDV